MVVTILSAFRKRSRVFNLPRETTLKVKTPTGLRISMMLFAASLSQQARSQRRKKKRKNERLPSIGSNSLAKSVRRLSARSKLRWQ